MEGSIARCFLCLLSTVCAIVKVFTYLSRQWEKITYCTSRDLDTKNLNHLADRRIWGVGKTASKVTKALHLPDGNKMSRQSLEVVAWGVRVVGEYTLTATSNAISIIGNGGIVVPSIVIQSSHNLCQDEGARVRWAKGLGHPSLGLL